MAANTTFFPPADPNVRLRAMFYALTPQETYAEHFQDMPDVAYISRPFFFLWVLLDLLMLLAIGEKKDARLHHVFINFTVGHITEAGGRFVSKGLELTAYLWIYHHHRLSSQPFDSVSTYVLCLIGVDLCTYWWHRMTHENSVLWAAHQLHHSCEDLNPSVAARISLSMLAFKWVFYLPLAFLGLPPTVYVIHSQMNFYYGALGHSRVWPKMQKILPGLASNKYCIDKNYGSLLIIWDRMFGTFEEEREGEELVYGVIDQKEATHIIGLQCRQNPRGQAEDPDVRPRVVIRCAADRNTRSKLRCGSPSTCSCTARWSWQGITDMATRMRAVGRGLGLVHFLYVVLAGTSLGGLLSSHRGSLRFEPVRLLLSLPLCLLLPVFASRSLATCLALTNAASLLLWPLVRTQALKMADKKEGRKTE
ncbi:hypothetical protein O3P69_014601 [Scylla paramamosain]|uniref:Fatty acid hydroxylase domain-containing protein n=1 Tax=Scylla paramamosain TaxID=85552 RepID=A0AAW0TX94_SCYPA